MGSSHFEQRYEVRRRIYSRGMGEILGGFDRIVGRDIGIKITAESAQVLAVP